MIYILLGNGFEEAEALVPLDLLRRAGAKVTLVGVDGLEVTGNHGVTVKADLSMDEAHDPEDMEMLVLPGGLGGVEAIQKNLFALALIQKAYDRGCWLCAICAAPTILARIGCLDRRKAVCYPGMENEMGSAVVQKGAQVVTDGRIITGEAAGSAFEFGLRLVEAACGREAMERVRDAVHFHH